MQNAPKYQAASEYKLRRNTDRVRIQGAPKYNSRWNTSCLKMQTAPKNKIKKAGGRPSPLGQPPRNQPISLRKTPIAFFSRRDTCA